MGGGTTKTHLTDGDSPASALLSDGSATYVPGVSEQRGGTTSFFLFDGLGSVRAVSGTGGSASEFSLSDAFGNPFATTDFGGATTSGRPFGFVGSEQYQQDAESGLMLLGNRYYDPSIGRFLSSDPEEDGDNFYAYVENNPVNTDDPEGLQAEHTQNKTKANHDQHTKRRAGGKEAKDPRMGPPPRKKGSQPTPAEKKAREEKEKREKERKDKMKPAPVLPVLPKPHILPQPEPGFTDRFRQFLPRLLPPLLKRVPGMGVWWFIPVPHYPVYDDPRNWG